jgi:DNA-binding HxlR family transcriptional regulator
LRFGAWEIEGVKTYGQYCPVARALDVVGDRWSLLIVRELLAGGRHFNAIERGLPGISRSLLARRLRLLERGGVLERHLGSDGRAREYLLTPAGKDLTGLMGILRDWGARWAFDDPRPHELDPAWLLSSMLHRCKPAELPKRRVVIEFRFRGSRHSMVWLILDPREEGDICLKHPGFEVDLVVSAEVRSFFRVWLSRLSRAEAERRGLLEIEGPPGLVRAFPRWFDWLSPPRTDAPARPRRFAKATG